MPHAHAHSDGHAHGHPHHGGTGGAPSDARGRSTRALRWALGITLVLLVGEVVGGILSNSLALLADAGHMLTDAGALGLSLFVAWLCRQGSAPEKTYGYLRWEILAALINGATLLLISGWIAYEAVLRFRVPEAVVGGTMLWVAVAGLLANGVAAWFLHGASDASLNMRGAYLHVMGDLLSSIGTVVAALLIKYTGWLSADPIASLLTTMLIVIGAWRLVREAVDVLLEAAPAHIALEQVRSRLEAIDGVASVHDLHVWTVTSGVVALSAHAIVPDTGRHQTVLDQAHTVLDELGIHHVTVQLESVDMHPSAPHLHP